MSVANYDPPMLAERPGTTLASMFPEDVVPSPADLAGLDQFHTGGLPATVRLAALLGLRDNFEVS